MILFITVTALPIGLMMMIEPGGETLGLTTNLLSGTPFQDFFVPGLILALIVGGSGLVSILLFMSQSRYKYKLALASGLILLLWMVTELMMTSNYHWLKGLYLAVAVLVVLTSYQLMGKAAF